MKNIILFFLLLAYLTSNGQFGKKHVTHLSPQLSVPHETNFSIKSQPKPALSNLLYGELPTTGTELNGETDFSKQFNVSKLEPSLEGPVHSSNVYDFRGNFVTSKLSYSFKKRH